MSAPLLAFQVWDAVGWAGQAFFTARVVHQWVASERARRSVVPRAYWTWSLAGTVLLLVYALHRRDPVFLAGFLVNGLLYARNWALASAPRTAGGAGRTSGLPVLVAAGAALAAVLWVTFNRPERIVPGVPWPWLVVGFVGQGIWSSRFVLQWYVSERLGRSVLPASFFWLSLVGSAVLFAYAVHRVDWVMMAAFLLNPIPYARNLVLIARERAPRPG